MSQCGAECLADLRSSCTDPRDDKRRIEDKKGGLLKGSYKWVLDHPEFKRYLAEDISRTLWIKGDAGKGKTMLLCGIIDELDASTRSGSLPQTRLISYFFCEATDTRLRSSTAVLKGLMYLLLDRHASLISTLEAKHKHTGKRLFDDSDINAFAALSDILEKLLCDSAVPPTFICINALDECEDGRSELLRFIRKMASTPTSRARWILTSRNWPEIQQELSFEDSRTTLSLELNADHVSQAIEAYIQHKASQLTPIRHNETLRRQVVSQLSKRADGTFLWVALVFQELLKCQITSKLLPLVETMPSGLTPLYGRMLDQISNNEHAETCRRVLSTATLASRPLHLKELQDLAGLNEVDDIEVAVNLCASFLTIRQDKVYLIHQSAKDYLGQHASDTVFEGSEANAHRNILLQSLRVMSAVLHQDMYELRRPGTLKTDISRPDPDPLAPISYACAYWIDHLLSSRSWERDGKDVLQFLNQHFLHWLESISILGVFSECSSSLRKLVHEVHVGRGCAL